MLISGSMLSLPNSVTINDISYWVTAIVANISVLVDALENIYLQPEILHILDTKKYLVDPGTRHNHWPTRGGWVTSCLRMQPRAPCWGSWLWMWSLWPWLLLMLHFLMGGRFWWRRWWSNTNATDNTLIIVIHGGTQRTWIQQSPPFLGPFADALKLYEGMVGTSALGVDCYCYWCGCCCCLGRDGFRFAWRRMMTSS